MTTINFSSYSLEELFQALEGIDDYEFQENALAIYQLLLAKLKIEPHTHNYVDLGYESNGFVEAIYIGLVDFPLDEIFEEIHIQNIQMKDKIMRLNALLLEKHKNNTD